MTAAATAAAVVLVVVMVVLLVGCGEISGSADDFIGYFFTHRRRFQIKWQRMQNK